MPPEQGPWTPTSDSDLAARGGPDDGADDAPERPSDVWSWLPRIPARQVRLERAVAGWSGSAAWVCWLDWLRWL